VRQQGSGRVSGEWRLARRRQAQHCSSPLQRSTEQRPLRCQWQGRQATQDAAHRLIAFI
jgi:hypothetical protein